MMWPVSLFYLLFYLLFNHSKTSGYWARGLNAVYIIQVSIILLVSSRIFPSKAFGEIQILTMKRETAVSPSTTWDLGCKNTALTVLYKCCWFMESHWYCHGLIWAPTLPCAQQHSLSAWRPCHLPACLPRALPLQMLSHAGRIKGNGIKCHPNGFPAATGY